MTALDELAGRHEIRTAEAMEELGRRIGSDLVAGDVLILTGPLGAGKTTFTRGLAAGLGVRGPVQSPTFVIARTHPSLIGGAPLVHMDAYRLGSAAELDDLVVVALELASITTPLLAEGMETQEKVGRDGEAVGFGVDKSQGAAVAGDVPLGAILRSSIAEDEEA